MIVNITADSNINTDIINGTMNFIIYGYDDWGRLIILGTVEATQGENGIWWAEYAVQSYLIPDTFIVSAEYIGLDYVTVHNGTLRVLYDTLFSITAEDVDYGTKVNVAIYFDDILSLDFEPLDLFVGDKFYRIDLWDLWNYTSRNLDNFTIPDILAAGQYNITAFYPGDI